MQVFVNVTGKNRQHPVELKYPSMISIQFILDDGQKFTVKDGGKGLRISVDGRLAVIPQASNVIQVSELRE